MEQVANDTVHRNSSIDDTVVSVPDVLHVKPSVGFLTGVAGSGKTYSIRQQIEQDPKFGVLCATTGIAAVNLGPSVTTINSLFRYYDVESLKEKYTDGDIKKDLIALARLYRNIIVDECSMMGAETLDIFYRALEQANRLKEVQDYGGIGMILVGDFCQLPPVEAAFAFEAANWKHFEENTTKLTKVYRQSNPDFLRALNAARCGEGDLAARILHALDGVSWLPCLNSKFDGTTICATNRQCDQLNEIRLDELIRAGNRQAVFTKKTWGTKKQEWADKYIPYQTTLCNNAYVMILANGAELVYANGDTGHITDVVGSTVTVKLSRTGRLVEVWPVTRRNMVKDHPDGVTKHPSIISKSAFEDLVDKDMDDIDDEYKKYLRQLTADYKVLHAGQPYFDFLDRKWCIGECTYMPIRLAYATTVHKSQGLTLDKVQIDYTAGFFNQAAMSYVALSRVKTHDGLYIVGGPSKLASRTNVCEDVLAFL